MDALAFAARTLLNLTPFGALLGGGSLTPAKVAAGLLALAASRWQKDRLAVLLRARLVSLVICRDEQTGKYLAVREASGWRVLTVEAQVGQTLGNAAVAHAAEQAGAQIKLAGLLTAELTRGPLPHDLLLRVVFFARPVRSQLLSAAAVGSAGAWFSLAELTALAHTPAPDGLVGHELLDWAAYLKGGGAVFPLELLTGRADAPSDALRAAAAALAADPVTALPMGTASHSTAEAKQLTAPAKGGASAFDVAGAQLAAVFAGFGRKSSKAE